MNTDEDAARLEGENARLKKILALRAENAALMLQLNCPEAALTRLPDIIRETCAQFKVNPDVLYSHCRTHAVVVPRQTVFYLAREHIPLSLHQIGAALGHDHTTVSYARLAVLDRLDTIPGYAAEVEQIESRLGLKPKATHE